MEKMKMTKKEYFKELRVMVEDSSREDRIELLAFIDKEIELLSRKRTTISAKDLEKRAENEKLADEVVDVLIAEDKAMTIADIKVAMGREELTSSKLAAVIKIAVADGRVIAEDGKKAKVYSSVK